MKEVSNVRIFKQAIWSTFKAEGYLSTKALHGLRDNLLAKGPRFDIRARPHCFASGCLEVRDSDLRQGQKIAGNMGPSYLIPIFTRE